VRFVDLVFRQGHLSEKAVVAAVMAGERPLHLDQCERCAARAVDLGRWLDHVRAEASGAADAAFPIERLAAQQAQILRRLEQLDEPARVIAFPATLRPTQRTAGLPRVAPAWLGVAAAAGLVIGVIGGQVTARLGAASTNPAAVQPAEAGTRVDAVLEPISPEGERFLYQELERSIPKDLEPLDNNTPRLIPVVAAIR